MQVRYSKYVHSFDGLVIILVICLGMQLQWCQHGSHV